MSNKQSEEIQQTKDYSQFKTLKGNRPVSQKHVKNLMASMQREYLKKPIEVNEKKEVIDGQHRLEAVKNLGLPLYYTVKKGYTLKQVQITNTNTRNWSFTDFMNGWIELGHKDYTVVKDFIAYYGFAFREALALLSGINNPSVVETTFREGTFKVKNLKAATEKADKLMMIKDHYAGYNRRSFINAMVQIMNKKEFVFEEFLHKLKVQPGKLVDCANTEQYKALIENIYNYYRTDKVNLRL